MYRQIKVFNQQWHPEDGVVGKVGNVFYMPEKDAENIKDAVKKLPGIYQDIGY